MINTPKQLVFVVVMSFLIPLAVILLIVNLITGGMDFNPDSPAMSEEAIAARLKPVGQVRVASASGETDSDAVAAANVVTAPAAAGAGPADKMNVAAAAPGSAAGGGEQVYKNVCLVCHAAGLAGAPKMGDKAAWEPRIAQGKDALYAAVINGKNAMPAKGGASNASDAEIKAAVDLMIDKAW